jgi:peptidoglycan/xylan/chitin deacetylase (PgdA/CDA1 family)
MPGNEPDRPLATDRRARIALIEDVNNRSKRLPDEARRTYLERLREEPLDIGEDWEDELFTFLSWSDVRSLRRRGFAIGSHTIDHSILSRTSRRQLSHQLRESKAAIERELRTECSCIVYPNGGPSDVSPEVMATARAAGYRLGFILTGRFNSPGQDPLALDRVSIPGHLPPCVFHSIVSGIHHLLGR